MILPGDIFLTHGAGLLPDMINAVEKLKSKDGVSIYSHCGICTGGYGTFESLSTIRHGDLLAYVGAPFMLVRAKEMTTDKYFAGMANVIDMDKAIYPFHRLFLIGLGLGRLSIRNWLVCSELAAKFLMYARVRVLDYCGVTPDNLSDEFHLLSYKYEILFEGTLTREFLGKEVNDADMGDTYTFCSNLYRTNVSQGRPTEPYNPTLPSTFDVLSADDAVHDDDVTRQCGLQQHVTNADDDATDGRQRDDDSTNGLVTDDKSNYSITKTDGGTSDPAKKKPVDNIENLKPSD